MADDKQGNARTSSVEAVYADLRHAREAIDELEARGIEAGDISLGGRPVARAADRKDTRRRDARVSRYVGARSGAGLAIGGILGAIIGVVLAIVLGGHAGAIAGAGVGGLIAGGAIGVMIGGVSSIDVAPDWELTFEPERGEGVVVEVRSVDPNEVSLAEQVLEKSHPRRIRHA